MDGMSVGFQINPNQVRFNVSLPPTYKAGLPMGSDSDVSCASMAEKLFQILKDRIPGAKNITPFPTLGCVEITCSPHQQHAVRQSLETFLGIEHVRDISDVVIL
ncbi:MAG: hypothetical protein IPJ69_10835 [Deltaproteobacteria bacterium]|nr:MAG: hypothetical protein IPJ69_10835 [Deltaproteobacteria bacterium]